MYDPVDAYFVGGPCDGQSYQLPEPYLEYKFALLKNRSMMYLSDSTRLPDRLDLDVAVYKYVGYGIYWFNRIEHE